MKKILLNFFKIAFFLGIGVFFIWFFVKDLSTEDKSSIVSSLRNANYFLVAVSVIIGLSSHIFRTLRWRLLFEPMGYKPGLPNTFNAVMIAYLANLALPRLGEVTRCGILKKYENIPFSNSLGTVIAERAFDLLTFVILFLINILIQFQQIKAYVYDKIYSPMLEKFNILNDRILIFVLVGILIFLVLIIYLLNKRFSKNKIFLKIKEMFIGFWNGLKSLSQIKKPFMFFFYTFLLWLSYFLTVYVCIFAMDETSGLNAFAPFSVLVFGTIGIMLVQGGIGIYPVISAETLVLYGIASVHGYAFGWLAWSAQTITIIILGVIALIVLPLINKKTIKNVVS